MKILKKLGALKRRVSNLMNFRRRRAIEANKTWRVAQEFDSPESTRAEKKKAPGFVKY